MTAGPLTTQPATTHLARTAGGVVGARLAAVIHARAPAALDGRAAVARDAGPATAPVPVPTLDVRRTGGRAHDAPPRRWRLESGGAGGLCEGQQDQAQQDWPGGRPTRWSPAALRSRSGRRLRQTRAVDFHETPETSPPAKALQAGGVSKPPWSRPRKRDLSARSRCRVRVRTRIFARPHPHRG